MIVNKVITGELSHKTSIDHIEKTSALTPGKYIYTKQGMYTPQPL